MREVHGTSTIVAQEIPVIAPAPRSHARWVPFGVVLAMMLMVGVPILVAGVLIQGPGRGLVRLFHDLSQVEPLPAAQQWLVGDWAAAGGETVTISKDSSISYRLGPRSGKSFLFIDSDGMSARVATLGNEFRIDFRAATGKGSSPTLVIDKREFKRVR